MRDEPAKLAALIDWEWFEREWAEFFPSREWRPATHPSRVWQIACGFLLGQCRILIAVVERTQSVYQRLFLGWSHEPSEKPEGQLVPRWGGCMRALAVLDSVEEALAGEAEGGAVPPGADGVFGTTGSERQ